MHKIETELDRLYSVGAVTVEQYRGMIAWREDGGGIRRGGHRKKAQVEPDGDDMRDIARRRFKRILHNLQRWNYAVATDLLALVMRDSAKADLGRVRLGADRLAQSYYQG